MDTYKEAKRRVDAQAMVNSGMRVLLEKKDNDWVAKECTLAFGAVGPRAALRMKKTEEFLLGKPWSLDTLLSATNVLKAELQACVVRSRGAAEYRVTVACSLLCRFFAFVAAQENIPDLKKQLNSALPDRTHHLHSGQQDYEEP